MSKLPVLMTADYWMNSQLSIAKFSGAIKVNGQQYIVVGSDLILKDWLPVYSKLGRARTIGLIENGTSLNVALQMMKIKDDNQLKLNL